MTQFAWAGVAFVAFLILAGGFAAAGLWYMGEVEEVGC